MHLTPEPLLLSADPAFRGDAAFPNPEQLLLAAASSCQLLSFLAVAARAGVDVVAYADDAAALMPDAASGMRITEIVLRPRITVRGSDESMVATLVETAHDQCFIANTLNATMRVEHTVELV
ncbi:OsmC family protein [Nocardioides pacificus]